MIIYTDTIKQQLGSAMYTDFNAPIQKYDLLWGRMRFLEPPF